MNKTIGIIVMTWGVIFCFWQTRHFGNNWFPQSPAEIFCDLTAFVMVASGYIINKQKQ